MIKIYGRRKAGTFSVVWNQQNMFRIQSTIYWLTHSVSKNTIQANYSVVLRTICSKHL